MRRAGIVTGATGHGPGDHLCWIHDGEASWRDVATTFLDDGASAPDRLLYTADKDPGGLVDDLAGLPGRDDLLAAGQLKVLPLSDAYAPGRCADATAALDRYAAEVVAAADAGYRTLRVAAEVTPLAATEEDARRSTALELLVDGLVARNGVSALCGYDRRVMGDRATRHVSFVHPLIAGAGPPAAALHADDGGRWRLGGEIDLEAHASLEAALSALSAPGDVHLDLGDLDFIDVAGTRALVSLAERLAPDGRVVVHDPPATLLLVLEAGWGDVPGVQVVDS